MKNSLTKVLIATILRIDLHPPQVLKVVVVNYVLLPLLKRLLDVFYPLE